MARSTPATSCSPAIRRGLVVVETDGFETRAALVRRGRKGRLAVEGLATARGSDPLRAAAEAVEALRNGPARLPRRAIVITVEATPACLDLPLRPGERPPRQLQNALRWEMEPRLAQRVGSRQIGSILVGQGALEPARAQEILRGMASQGGAGRRTEGTPRFGELAQQQGWVEPGQVGEALELQRWFTAEDVDPTCGWAVHAPAAGAGEARWLVASLCRDRRDRWREMLREKGLELAGLYPLPGAPLGALPPEAWMQPSICLQIERGLLVRSETGAGGAAAIELHYTGEQAVSPERCLEVLGAGGASSVWICGGAPGVADLALELSARNGRFVHLLRPKTDRAPEGIPPESLGAMLGACRHALGEARRDSVACVPPRDPSPPILARPPGWWIASLAALALVMIGAEIGLAKLARGATDRAGGLVERREELEAERDRVLATNREGQRLQAQLESGRSELGELREREGFIRQQLLAREREIPRRAVFLPGVLSALSHTVGEGVYLTRVRELDPYVLEIEGWSVSDEAAQVFCKALAAAAVDLRLGVLEQSTELRSGRGGAEAWGFRLRLGPRGEIVQ